MDKILLTVSNKVSPFAAEELDTVKLTTSLNQASQTQALPLLHLVWVVVFLKNTSLQLKRVSAL